MPTPSFGTGVAPGLTTHYSPALSSVGTEPSAPFSKGVGATLGFGLGSPAALGLSGYGPIRTPTQLPAQAGDFSFALPASPSAPGHMRPSPTSGGAPLAVVPSVSGLGGARAGFAPGSNAAAPSADFGLVGPSPAGREAPRRGEARRVPAGASPNFGWPDLTADALSSSFIGGRGVQFAAPGSTAAGARSGSAVASPAPGRRASPVTARRAAVPTQSAWPTLGQGLLDWPQFGQQSAVQRAGRLDLLPQHSFGRQSLGLPSSAGITPSAPVAPSPATLSPSRPSSPTVAGVTPRSAGRIGRAATRAPLRAGGLSPAGISPVGSSRELPRELPMFGPRSFGRQAATGAAIAAAASAVPFYSAPPRQDYAAPSSQSSPLGTPLGGASASAPASVPVRPRGRAASPPRGSLAGRAPEGTLPTRTAVAAPAADRLQPGSSAPPAKDLPAGGARATVAPGAAVRGMAFQTSGGLERMAQVPLGSAAAQGGSNAIGGPVQTAQPVTLAETAPFHPWSTPGADLPRNLMGQRPAQRGTGGLQLGGYDPSARFRDVGAADPGLVRSGGWAGLAAHDLVRPAVGLRDGLAPRASEGAPMRAQPRSVLDLAAPLETGPRLVPGLSSRNNASATGGGQGALLSRGPSASPRSLKASRVDLPPEPGGAAGPGRSATRPTPGLVPGGLGTQGWLGAAHDDLESNSPVFAYGHGEEAPRSFTPVSRRDLSRVFAPGSVATEPGLPTAEARAGGEPAARMLGRRSEPSAASLPPGSEPALVRALERSQGNALTSFDGPERIAAQGVAPRSPSPSTGPGQATGEQPGWARAIGMGGILSALMRRGKETEPARPIGRAAVSRELARSDYSSSQLSGSSVRLYGSPGAPSAGSQQGAREELIASLFARGGNNLPRSTRSTEAPPAAPAARKSPEQVSIAPPRRIASRPSTPQAPAARPAPAPTTTPPPPRIVARAQQSGAARRPDMAHTNLVAGKAGGGVLRKAVADVDYSEQAKAEAAPSRESGLESSHQIGGSPEDLSLLVNQLYRQIKRELTIERERRGGSY